jgi:drug/metabolite transporter (DMT)-like permease
MRVLLGLIAALGAAVAYGVASVLQAVGTRRLESGSVDARFLLRLTRSLPYVAGLVLDAAGFVATVVALRVLPLFVVESAVASSVGVTALVAARFLGARLLGREWTALVVLGAGLVALAVSAQAEAGEPLGRAGQWVVLVLSLALAAATAVLARAPTGGAALFATAAGLGFAGVGIAARALATPSPWWHLLGEPLAWALVVGGVVAIVAYATALQRGAVTVVAAVTFAVETVVPAVAGYVLLGDRARPGFLPVAVAGLLLTLAAAISLSRYSEPDAPAAVTVG